MDNKRSVVVHLITPYLFHTGSWVYSQLTEIRRYENVVFTQRKENIELFPLKNVYSPDDFGRPREFVNRIYRRLTDSYGLYFNKLFKTINPSLFHAHMGFEAVRWLEFVKRSRRPLITTFYGLDVSKLGRMEEWQRRYKTLFSYGSLFLAEGTHLKKQLVDLGCPSSKIIVQHLGVAVDRYPVKSIVKRNANDTVIILQVSSFREKKGIEYSIRAIAEVVKQNPRIEFRIIGNGDSPDADTMISRLVQQLNLTNKVKLLGTRSHSDTIQEMLHADIFLHPSVTAADGDNEGGAPVGIIEASAVGLPVVSTIHADIPEVVLDNLSGFLVPERDIESLAKALLDLVASPRKRASFGGHGRKHIDENYNLTTQIEKLEHIYDMVSNDW